MPIRNRFNIPFLLLLVVLAAGGYFRTSGLFRGLERGVIYHPDSPKQVMMLGNYLQGNYLQFYDSLFYDGYPYGLNRVDELIIRSVRAVLMPVQALLNPERSIRDVPSRIELFYWGRILRVLYGLLTVILIYAAVRKLGGGSWAALGAASLYALAPLGATVTHCVTGDVGVDLFLAAAVWCLAGYATENRTRWLWFYGLACGVAFSCKYQGALGAWLMIVTFALLIFRDRNKTGALVRQALGIALSFIIGMFAGTPALMVDPEKAWRNIRKNFLFIRNYGVSEEFLEQPFLQKVTYGLSHNMPLAMYCIGWIFMLLALLALIHSAIRYFRSLAYEDEKRKSAVYFAMASFPFMALILATALKPEVQPFHFTFLLPVMAIAIGFMFRDVSITNRPSLKWAATAILLVALAESLRSGIREDFFWRRSDIAGLAEDYSNAIFEEQSYASKNYAGLDTIKHFYVEPSTLPVFRNRPTGLWHPDSARWLNLHQLPVPAVPLPMDNMWIFMNGPVFPRNDRMFAVPVNVPGIDRTVVFNDEPKGITLGLRTGHLPARFMVRAPGDHQTIFLAPHSQRIITLAAAHSHNHFKGKSGKPDTYLVPLRLRARLGQVWVTLLDDDRDTANFLRFGPAPSASAAQELPALADSELEKSLASLKYVQGTNMFSVPTESIPLPDFTAPLAAYAYTFLADVLNTGVTQTLKLELIDLSGLNHRTAPFVTQVAPGFHEIRWRFEKAFAPYDASIWISSETNGLSVQSWRLKPDPQGISKRKDQDHEPDVSSIPERPLDVTYPGIGIIRSIRIPDVLNAGTSFTYAVRMELDEDIEQKVFLESVLFLHIKDSGGRTVASLDVPLRVATVAPDMINWEYYSLPATGIVTGAYHLDGGIYNERTRLRYSFERPVRLTADLKRRQFRCIDLTIR